MLAKRIIELTKLAHWAESTHAAGKSVFLPRGLSDVYRVFAKNGARSNRVILDRVAHLKTFVRHDRKINFDNVALFIIANVDKNTRTFSLNGGVQSQIAQRLNISQATVSRILSLMIQMRVIRHAFSGDNAPNDPKSGLIGDRDNIPLNAIYYVCDDFGYLAGKTAGDKLLDAFKKADVDASKSGFNITERLMLVRNTLWDGTIGRRSRGITTAHIKNTIKKITDRSRAAEIVYKRLSKRGDFLCIDSSQIDKIINAVLKSAGFGCSESLT